ncbi:LacI family DNA-binding transcriptional regulator [Pelomonas sp. Root1217]|uniref:LacI family DNA-binding transcriptional regulator n=1 Tax=Pelomonas sp. Root1217 TaxID=1736430 RepID=UPI0009E9AE45|nr:LacI family DNA-binding transcriptional regulator [Pelomonas sp. Root1217]
MPKPSRLSEVAKLAGVAPITASRAIRGTGYVSEDARARVMEAAAKLNYSPDMVARRMRGEKSRLIGIFVNNFGSLVLHEITKEISNEARARGYDILLFNADRFDAPGRADTRDMLANLCAGLILPMPNVEDAYLGDLEHRQLPCVFVNFDARAMELPVVVVENRKGARTAVEHLLSLGHRRIAFIAGSHYTGQSTERQAAYVEALNAAGIAADPALIVPGRFVQTGGYAATLQLLTLPEPPTAIFAANDEMAFGAIDAIHSKGLRVPEDISVVGFDDIAISSHIHPPLTTMRQPLVELSACAVRELVALIEGQGVAARKIALPLELVVRKSTGPVALRG